MTTPATLEIDADLERLKDVRQFIRDVAPGLGADESAVIDLVQSVDEWVTNVIVHGYRSVGGPIEIELTSAAGEIVARVRDKAPRFDPATAPVFNPDLPLEHRPLGKMGIHLIREMCDRFEHRVLLEGGNETTFARRAVSTAEQPGGKREHDD